MALEQGLGKSVISAVDAIPPVLVVCTAAMKYRWKFEFSVWRPDLKCQVFDNKTQEIDWTADVWIVNYDIVWKMQLPLCHTVIVDEAHYCKTEGTRRTSAVLTHTTHSKRVRFLSGTPMLNRPIEMFTLLDSLGALGGMSWYSYGMNFCDGWRPPWGGLNFNGSSNLDRLYELVAPSMLRMTKKMVAPELPPKTYRIIELDGHVTKREEDLWLEFEKANLSLPVHSIAFQAISDIRREHARRKLPQAVRYVKDLLESGVEKVVLFGHHRETIESLVEELDEYGVVFAYGGVSAKDVNKRVQAFQEDSKVRVFVGNIQSAGEGITLTAASHVVFVEPDWVPGKIAQAADRCHRIGTVNPVTVDLLCVQGSIDARMLWSVLDKLEVIDQVIKETELMDYAKIAELLRALADEFDKSPSEAETEEVKKKVTKAKPKPKPEPKEEEEISDEDLLGEEEEEEEVTLDDVKKAAAAAISAGHRDGVLQVFKDHGAKKVSEIGEKDYASVANAINELIEE